MRRIIKSAVALDWSERIVSLAPNFSDWSGISFIEKRLKIRYRRHKGIECGRSAVEVGSISGISIKYQVSSIKIRQEQRVGK
jgi:hypothetical protein